ncbi:MAG: hypothetical protein KY462_08735 [Actinobacteria bacterium]|nr:hypothetical protein [Actinomycetota bacterium]
MADRRAAAGHDLDTLADVANRIDLDPVDRQALHLETDPTRIDDSDSDREHLARYGRLEDLIDAFVEAYNAHDVDRVVELLSDDAELPGLGDDVAGFIRACGTLWDQRPHAILTRGLLDDEPVAVLWDIGERSEPAVASDIWTRMALLCFDRAGDGDEDTLGLIEGVDDPASLEAVDTDSPDPDLVEGARWREWDEGADG